MMRYDRQYLICGLSYVIAGMCLGIFMAASHNHDQRITHAHLNLVGFMLSLVYGVIHKLWLAAEPSKLAKTQFILHHAGTVSMIVGLFLMFNHNYSEEQLEPVLKSASLAVLLAAALMLTMVFKTEKVKA